MFIVNDPNSEPTFDGNVGLSWIDLTIVRLTHRDCEIEDWEVSEEESLSDHTEINFTYSTVQVQFQVIAGIILINLTGYALRKNWEKHLHI